VVVIGMIIGRPHTRLKFLKTLAGRPPTCAGRQTDENSDHDPLFEAHRWMANLRILEINEIKTVPHVPLSHPFVECLIGTMRREFLDQVLFWNAHDLERKLAEFQAYYNAARGHASMEGYTPLTFVDKHAVPVL
jgi:putative transposase